MSDTMCGEDALDLAHTSLYLGYSPNTVNARWKEWNLPPTKMGGKNYWFKADLDKWLARRIAVPYGDGTRYHQPRAA
jgi:hypothetical protein